MADIQGGQFLSYLFSKDENVALLFRKVLAAINNLGRNTGASPVGFSASPTPINGINVKGTVSNGVITAPGEMLHLTLAHNGAIVKGTQYFTEVSTEPAFLQPHVFAHGASRTLMVPLPTLDDNSNPVNYYVRSYAQLPGSLPSKPTVLGGLTGATIINMFGTTAMSLLPSTGSGTAPSNGSRGGSGIGKVLTSVPAVVPKRSVGGGK